MTGLGGALKIVLIVLLAASILTVDATYLSAQAKKSARVGWLQLDASGPSETASINVEMLRRALSQRGYVEGSTLVFYDRSVVGPYARAVEAVKELLQVGVDVIVVRTALEAAIARSVTTTTPIVFVAVSDPVALKLVDSLARPGANLTGVSYLGIELNTKRLELAKAILPSLSRVGVLGDAEHPLYQRSVADLERVASTLRLAVHPVGVKSIEEVEEAFKAMTTSGAQAVVVLQSPRFVPARQRLAATALKHRLPSIFENVRSVEAGGFVSYGADVGEMFNRASYYVDRIVGGTKPAVLPVEQSSKLELVINMNTARVLRLAIPPSVLVRADRVIE